MFLKIDIYESLLYIFVILLGPGDSGSTAGSKKTVIPAKVSCVPKVAGH
jgi:hypothetical protein